MLEKYNKLFYLVFEREGNIIKMKNKDCFTLNVNSKEIAAFFRLILPNIFSYIGKSKEEIISAFARGFVDAEGHIDKKRPTITVSQKEKQILRYLQMLLLRLGVRSTIKFDIGKKKISILRIADRDILNYAQIGFTAKDKQETFANQLKKVQETYKKEMTPVKRKELWALLKEAGIFPFAYY